MAQALDNNPTFTGSGSSGRDLLHLLQGLKTSDVSNITSFLRILLQAMRTGFVPGISVDTVMSLGDFLASVRESDITGAFLDNVQIKVACLLRELLLKNNISDESRDEVLKITKNIREFSDDLIVFFKEGLHV